MNRLPYLILITGLVFISCYGFQKVDTEKIKTITLSDLSSDYRLFDNEIKSEGIILHVPKGSALPFDVQLDIPVALFNQGNNTLVFTRDIYLYMNKSTFLISDDKNRWTRIDDMETLKKMFNVKEGSLSISFKAEKGKQPRIVFSIKTR